MLTSHRGRQAALRLRAGCMKEVRFSQLAEMWGKEPLAEGTAWRKTPSHKMASDGVSGAHVPPKRLGLDPANGGMWPLDGCWERFLALKNGQEGRRQGDQAGGCYYLSSQRTESVVSTERAQVRFYIDVYRNCSRHLPGTLRFIKVKVISFGPCSSIASLLGFPHFTEGH